MKSEKYIGWKKVLLLAGSLIAMGVMYSWYAESALTMKIINRILADTGILFIGYSIAAGSLRHFFGWETSLNQYRKELGVVGFLLIVLHGVVTLALPQFSLTTLTQSENIVGFTFAVLSFVILTVMTLSSVEFIKNALGPVWWRKVLRFGFFAYVFGVLHAVIKSWPLWVAWTAEGGAFPPFGFWVMIVVVAMLILKSAQEIQKITSR